MKHLAFPKNRRLTSNRQFKAVLDHGRRAGDRLLTVYAAPNDRGYPRLGVSVGRATGNAVVRNRLKRLIREAFRRSQDRIPPAFDYVVMIAPALSRRLKPPARGARAAPSPQPRGAGGFAYQQVEASFVSLVAAALNQAGESRERTSRKKETKY